jgi:hypothetical protein
MAGFFSETIKAQVEGRNPHAAILTEHNFPDGTVRNWTGFKTLNFDGFDWIGQGELVSFSDMSFGADDSAQTFSATLSGVNPALVAEARTGPPVRGHTATYWLLFFDPQTLQPLDQKYLLSEFIMDVIGYSGVGPAQRTVTLSYETIWSGLNHAEYATWSDPDQKSQYPDDRGFEFVAEMVPGTRVNWPNF